MRAKYAILLFFVFSAINAFCQGKTAPKPANRIGQMITKDGQKEDILFNRFETPNDYSTKYILSNKEGVELYEVGFRYDPEGDSMRIYFFDKQRIKTEYRVVKFRSIDSHVLIQDYKLNEQEDKQYYSILFSLDSNRITASLYQFQGIDANPVFVLEPIVPAEVRERHAGEVAIYINWKKRQEAIAALKNEMLAYRADKISWVKHKENAVTNGKATNVASQAMQEEFTRSMDNIILPYFKTVHPLTDDDLKEVIFTFYCDGNGKIKIDTIGTIIPTNGPRRSWFCDSFYRNVKPVIEAGEYKTLTTTLENATLKTDFDKRFSDSMRFFGADDFANEVQAAYSAFDPYLRMTINSPVKYNYKLAYKATKRYSSWKISVDGPNKVKLKDITEKPIELKEPDTPFFRSNFIKTIMEKKLPDGKYDLVIYDVFVNDMNNPASQKIEYKKR